MDKLVHFIGEKDDLTGGQFKHSANEGGGGAALHRGGILAYHTAAQGSILGVHLKKSFDVSETNWQCGLEES